MEYIIGVVVALVGWLLFERTKRKSAEALLENLDLKSKILQNLANREFNKLQIEDEEKNRNRIKKDLKETEKDEKLSREKILDILNNSDK